MSDLPEPPVPAEVDLRGFEFMPLYGDRLMTSATWIGASAEAKVAALRLWWHSYAHEVPASSLPDNDQLLADYAGYGVAVKAWQKIKPQTMRGWCKCNDGRWYHTVVAGLAMEAWVSRQAHKVRTLRARIAAMEKRLSDAKTDDQKLHIKTLLLDLQQSLSQTIKKPVTDEDSSQLHGPKGQGQGQGQGQDRTGIVVIPGTDVPGGKPRKDPIKDEIWASALPLLQGQFGETAEVRSYLGKLCKDYGQLLVVEAVRDAVLTPPLDAKAWLVARCQERRALSGNKSAALEARNQESVKIALREAGHG